MISQYFQNILDIWGSIIIKFGNGGGRVGFKMQLVGLVKGLSGNKWVWISNIGPNRIRIFCMLAIPT